MMKKQQGLTLIEIMIALVLGLFIIAVTLTIYINIIKSSGDTMKSARLNHDLGMTMSLMTNDIKRAGYWGGAVIGASSLNNPFTVDELTSPATAARTNVQILTANSTTVADPGTCILYTYDADGDGVVDPNEYYGFRLNVGSIQMRTTGTTTANCTDGNWERITDENMINITDVQFSFASMVATAATTAAASYPELTATSRCYNPNATPPDTNSLICSVDPAPVANQKMGQNRVVNIRLTGKLIGADNAEVIKGLSDSVKIRSIRIFIRP
jgi:prepilin peptidase dependent protein B